MGFPILNFHRNGTIWSIVFCDCFLSLSMMFSILIHVVACISTSLFFMSESYSIVWISFYLFICWWTFECCHLLTIRNNTAMNIHVQKVKNTLTSTQSPKYCVAVHFKNYIKRLSYYMKSLALAFSWNLTLPRGTMFCGVWGRFLSVCLIAVNLWPHHIAWGESSLPGQESSPRPLQWSISLDH